jgi:hypothetical protein
MVQNTYLCALSIEQKMIDMKQFLVFLSCFSVITSVMAQQKNFSYTLYGFVRNELFYNSRKNVEAVDGDFNLFPLNSSPDSQGKDLNASPNSSLYSFATRLGLDLVGPEVGRAGLSAKIEADFTGSPATPFLLYLRQAYLRLKWEKGASLLVGHAWHPLFGEVAPDVLNLSTGSPFQPFNRSPMLNLQYTKGRISFEAAAIYQLTSLSPGVNGKSEEYLKNSILPELFAGIKYRHKGLLAGLGVEMLSIKPRLQATGTIFEGNVGIAGGTYKVNERLTTTSFMAQAHYKTGKLFIAGKSFLASNLGHTLMLGGYGIASVDGLTGKQTYTSLRHSTSWLNVTYGDKWRGGLYLGYSKNLGTNQALISNTFYGTGFDIDQLAAALISFSYNLPHWKAGIEYSATTAWYGRVNLLNGKVSDTHPISNHRVLGLIAYLF